MEIIVLISLTMLYIQIGQVCSMKCYKCSVPEEIKISEIDGLPRVTPTCTLFDASLNYVINCDYSTMCIKTISTMYLQNGITQNTITRDCAPQQYSTLVFRNGSWENQYVIKEVYTEGCTSINDNEYTTSKKTICYCRGDLCNTAVIGTMLTKSTLTLPFILIICYMKLNLYIV